jgi:hypothetical protein
MVMASMDDWHSSRDLACVWGVQNVSITRKLTAQIYSAVPVFGEDETYIALVVEHNCDAQSGGYRANGWAQNFDILVMLFAGPDGSHKTQVIARGQSWVYPWPRDERESKQFEVLLEDKT